MQSYSGANVCEDSTIINGCEDSYVKVTYGQGGNIRYYPKDEDSPNGICTSGDADLIGTACDANDECAGIGGIC